MGNHSANGLEENFRWRTVMEGTRLLRVDDMAFVEEVMVAELLKGARKNKTRRGQ